MRNLEKYTCNNFNQSLDSWNVSNVATFNLMFSSTSFNNGDASGVSGVMNWTISGAYTAASMFYNNSAFNQDMSSWDVSGVTSSTGFLNFTELCSSFSTANYDALLASWSAQNVQSGVQFDTDATYTFATHDGFKTTLVGKGWTITDDGSV